MVTAKLDERRLADLGALAALAALLGRWVWRQCRRWLRFGPHTFESLATSFSVNARHHESQPTPAALRAVPDRWGVLSTQDRAEPSTCIHDFHIIGYILLL